jgi:hypothetical protein
MKKLGRINHVGTPDSTPDSQKLTNSRIGSGWIEVGNLEKMYLGETSVMLRRQVLPFFMFLMLKGEVFPVRADGVCIFIWGWRSGRIGRGAFPDFCLVWLGGFGA